MNCKPAVVYNKVQNWILYNKKYNLTFNYKDLTQLVMEVSGIS